MAESFTPLTTPLSTLNKHDHHDNGDSLSTRVFFFNMNKMRTTRTGNKEVIDDHLMENQRQQDDSVRKGKASGGGHQRHLFMSISQQHLCRRKLPTFSNPCTHRKTFRRKNWDAIFRRFFYFLLFDDEGRRCGESDQDSISPIGRKNSNGSPLTTTNCFVEMFSSWNLKICLVS